MMPDYTEWLNDLSESNDKELFSELYIELQHIAAGRMLGENANHSLNATALVHDAWLRLQKSAPEQWRDRKQFYAAATDAMRRILVEAARRRLAEKRGGGQAHLQIDEVNPASPLSDERLLGIHEILDQLEEKDESAARIVKLKFFAGMNYREIASLLELSEKTVQRQWGSAKVWLYRALKE